MYASLCVRAIRAEKQHDLFKSMIALKTERDLEDDVGRMIAGLCVLTEMCQCCVSRLQGAGGRRTRGWMSGKHEVKD